ncbi:MAG: hypothetical protein R6U36_04805 [Candidatus Fermentibacteraceae bacterium]
MGKALNAPQSIFRKADAPKGTPSPEYVQVNRRAGLGNFDDDEISDRALAGENVGDISITNGGTTYAYIEETLGSSQGIVYTTRANHSLYVSTANFTSGTVNGNKFLFSRACQVSSNGRTLHFWESTFQQDIRFDVTVPFRVPPKTDFTIEAKSSSNSNELSVYIGAVLLEEDT